MEKLIYPPMYVTIVLWTVALNKNQINNWLNQDYMQKKLGYGVIELTWVKNTSSQMVAQIWKNPSAEQPFFGTDSPKQL